LHFNKQGKQSSIGSLEKQTPSPFAQEKKSCHNNLSFMKMAVNGMEKTELMYKLEFVGI